MNGQRKSYEDDDGRTIADMSGLSENMPRLFGALPQEKKERPVKPEQKEQMSRREQFYAVAGALRASLLIALVYIAGFGAVIWLLLKLWN